MYPQKAALTYLQGKAYRVHKDQDRVALIPAMTIGPGDTIQTGKACRLELSLPDHSILRFNEETEFIIKDLFFSTSLNQRRVTVLVVKGMVWARIRKSIDKRSRFEINFPCIQAIAQEATLRINLHPGNYMMAKLYNGEAILKYPYIPKIPAYPDLCSGGGIGKNRSWTHLLAPMHQLVIFPEGRVTKPFRFAAKADLDDWVLWNQQRGQLNDPP
jgi:hypothetical protein